MERSHSRSFSCLQGTRDERLHTILQWLLRCWPLLGATGLLDCTTCRMAIAGNLPNSGLFAHRRSSSLHRECAQYCWWLVSDSILTAYSLSVSRCSASGTTGMSGSGQPKRNQQNTRIGKMVWVMKPSMTLGAWRLEKTNLLDGTLGREETQKWYRNPVWNCINDDRPDKTIDGHSIYRTGWELWLRCIVLAMLLLLTATIIKLNSRTRSYSCLVSRT